MADEAPPEDGGAGEQPPKEPQLPLPLTAENPGTLLMTLQVPAPASDAPGTAAIPRRRAARQQQCVGERYGVGAHLARLTVAVEWPLIKCFRHLAFFSQPGRRIGSERPFPAAVPSSSALLLREAGKKG